MQIRTTENVRMKFSWFYRWEALQTFCVLKSKIKAHIPQIKIALRDVPVELGYKLGMWVTGKPRDDIKQSKEM